MAFYRGLLSVLLLIVGNIVATQSDEILTVTRFIQNNNYPVETHSYETEDGYQLKAHRIPHGLTNKKTKHVALLVHGMGGSGENFITLGAPDALAFYLADRGYDVWLFNARGTVHSRKHRSLNPNRNRREFWNFSWHEIGIYDLPSTIDYILKTTSAKKLFYVGHSQGTTSYFVMLSELPEMNKKIQVAVMLCPSAYLWYTQAPFFHLIVRFVPIFQRLLSMLNWHEFFIPNSPSLNNILSRFCKPESMRDLCLDIVYTIGGAQSGLVNKTILPVLFQFSPTGLSVRQIWHYAQVIASGEFKQYDYGKKKNLKFYNDTKPPLYKLSNVKAPTALFYSPADSFANSKMVKELMKVLPNAVLKHEVSIENFNHLDFLFAYNVREIIHEPLYELFKQYEEINNV